jgi:cell wall-associated NlpC family hydrolase
MWAGPYIGRTDLNCWELVRLVYENQLGIQLPLYGEVDSQELYSVAAAVAEGTAQHETWSSVQPFPGQERSFDVAIMRGWLPCTDGHLRRDIIHTGLITRPGYVMHTDMAYQVVEVPLRHVTVCRRLVGCYRHAARN